MNKVIPRSVRLMWNAKKVRSRENHGKNWQSLRIFPTSSTMKRAL